MSDFEEAYKRLKSWADSLNNVVEGSYDEIKDALNPETKLPKGCPSHASLAELVLRQVKKKLREVNGAVEDVEKAIWKEGA